MTPGKLASQAGHAYTDTALSADPQMVAEWKDASHGIKVCLKTDSEEKLHRLVDEARELGIPATLVEDLGYTVFEGRKTVTAAGFGPLRRGQFPALKKLSLLP